MIKSGGSIMSIFFGDYPQNFTNEEKALFDKENPYWANFFFCKKKWFLCIPRWDFTFLGFVFRFAVEIFNRKFSTKLIEFLKNVNFQKQGTFSPVDEPGFFGQPDAINIVFLGKNSRLWANQYFCVWFRESETPCVHNSGGNILETSKTKTLKKEFYVNKMSS